MAKMTPKTFETFEAGAYEANRVEFFTVDDNGDPVYVTQETKYGIRMVARYRTFYNDDEGPPGSIGPEDVALFAKAFGVDPKQLPSDNLQALAALERLIASADKTVTINVGDSGWVRYVQGMDLPDGEYLFKYVAINTRNEEGEPTWREGEYGVFATVALEVVKNADGTDSPYKGSGITLWMRKESFAVLRALVPTIVEAMLGPEEGEVAQLAQLASQSSHWIYGEYGLPPNAKRSKLLLYTLRSVEKGEAAISPSSVDVEEELEAPFIEYLYTAIADGVAEHFQGSAFTSSGDLSEVGRGWCGEHLRALCKEHKIPNSFDKMTKTQVMLLLQGVDRQDLVDKMAGDGEDDGDW